MMAKEFSLNAQLETTVDEIYSIDNEIYCIDYSSKTDRVVMAGDENKAFTSTFKGIESKLSFSDFVGNVLDLKLN